MAKRQRALDRRAPSVDEARPSALARPSARPEPPASPSPLPPAAASDVPCSQAVNVLERAMRALQRHEYAEAKNLFDRLLAGFPSERALLERVRVYADLCSRELAGRPNSPVTIEERLTAATAALNNGDDRRAEMLADMVLADDPAQDLALYLLAAVEARRGRRHEALARLRRAIDLSPDVSAQAKNDPDFNTLRNLDEFHRLVNGSAQPSIAARRRGDQPER